MLLNRQPPPQRRPGVDKQNDKSPRPVWAPNGQLQIRMKGKHLSHMALLSPCGDPKQAVNCSFPSSSSGKEAKGKGFLTIPTLGRRPPGTIFLLFHATHQTLCMSTIFPIHSLSKPFHPNKNNNNAAARQCLLCTALNRASAAAH
jgi:hypothetical protein